MRKLTLLLLALAIALYAHSVVAGAGSAAGYILRDGLFLFAVAATLFGLAAGALPVAPVAGILRRWPLGGRIVAGLSLGGAVTAAVLGLGGVWGITAWLAGLILLAVGVFWPGEPLHYSRPAYRWTTDAAGRWVRSALGQSASVVDAASRAEGPPSSARFMLTLPLLFVLALAVFLRVWRLAELPAGCLGLECSRALSLVEGAPPNLSLFDLLAQLLYRFTQDGLVSLRLAGALLGILTLPAFYWAARPLDRAGGAALATMLLALSPWHLWVSRTSDPWIAAPLLGSLALGAGLRALSSLDRRWWWAAGLAFGLLLLDAHSLPGAALVWMAVAAVIGAWSLVVAPTERTLLPARLLNVAAFLAAATVVALPGLAAARPQPAPADAAATGLYTALAGLLHSGGAAWEYLLDRPLLAAWPAALAALGMGRIARSLAQPRAALIAAGLAAAVVALARYNAAGESAATLGLLLLPFLFLGVAAALDTLLDVFMRVWRPLVPAHVATGAALALVLAAGSWQAYNAAQGLQTAGVAEGRSTDAAMGRFAAACLAAPSYATCVQGETDAPADPSYRPVIYAPAAVLAHPAARLTLGAAADSDQVRVLDIVRDIPPSRLHDGALLYLAPIEDQPLISLLQQVYPHAETQAHPRTDGPTQFVVIAVPAQDLAQRQGLQGQYFAAAEFGAAQEAFRVSRDGPLHFAWAAQPPHDGPLSVIWEGSLRVPAAGVYAFAVDLPPAADEDTADAQPAFTLQLDDRLMLDSTLGLLENDEMLAQGFYRFAMRYRAERPAGDWTVRWQPPGDEWEAIPLSALYNPALPDVGLIGSYYAGEGFQGPTLAVRKDFILGAEADLPRPYSVRWQGKLAVPRAGEHLFAVTANGAAHFAVDGRELLAYAPAALDPSAPAYTQASVYLSQGWCDLEIRYTPADDRPNLRILWQPPGSSPALLFSRYLRPALGELYPGDAPLPPAPDLLDPRLGDDAFALSYVSELAQPQTVMPPADLPPLLLEEVWRVDGGCGPGADQLNAPHGVAADAAAGRVYVADTGNRRILAYDLVSGAAAGVYGEGAFEEAADLAVGPAGEVIALDAVAQQIVRIDAATGELAPLTLDTSFYRPRGLAVDEAGRMLVADTGGGRVVLLDSTGRTLAQFGGVETALGRGQPVDALFAGGSLWAVTAEDGRLWRLDDLAGITAIPRANTVDGPHLAGLADGSYFVTDPAAAAVRYHAASGQPLRQFAYPGLFANPVGVAAAEAGDLVYLAVSDSATCTLSVWRGVAAGLRR